MGRRIMVFMVIIALMLITNNVYGEHSVWDCPGCGRTGNTGNYCGSCAHPAPWLESGDAGALTIEVSQRYSQKRYVAA